MWQNKVPTSDMSSALSALLGSEVVSTERIGGGRNSRVYKLNCGASGCYVAKLYPRSQLDGRDRLDAEFTGLQFLRDNGIACVPRPVTADRKLSCAVYEYVEGDKIPPSDVTPSDVDQAVQFLLSLKDLSRRAGSERLPIAAEACFSVEAVFTSIQTRLNRLLPLQEQGPHYLDLHRFLVNEYVPSLAKLRGWCELKLVSEGESFSAELKPHERTLSPSDFGFHNTLRRPNGQIVFLDFEYFGWDDPAKMISDFLLHPAMDLGNVLKNRFLGNILGGYQDFPYLASRVTAVYSTWALKWCLILLNEFVPEHLVRRSFASETPLDESELQFLQLSKARRMLRDVMDDYQHFPYQR
jgi:hypothetical protein